MRILKDFRVEFINNVIFYFLPDELFLFDDPTRSRKRTKNDSSRDCQAQHLLDTESRRGYNEKLVRAPKQSQTF